MARLFASLLVSLVSLTACSGSDSTDTGTTSASTGGSGGQHAGGSGGGGSASGGGGDASGGGGSAPVRGVYGTAVAADSKGNQRVGGGTAGHVREIAHRFRATRSSAVSAVTWERRCGNGYSAGHGGVAHVTVQSDDDTSAHLPSGHVLASVDYVLPTPLVFDGVNIRLEFPTHPALTAGALYHVVWENTDPDPVANYFSVNEIYRADTLTPRQPAWSDDDLAVLTRSGTDPWVVDAHHTPVMALELEDGSAEGNAYFAVMTEQAGAIGGDAMVRERFTAEGADRIVTEVWARIGHEMGTGALTMRLENEDASLVEAVTVAADVNDWNGQVGDNGDWVGAAFAQPHRLKSGETHHLVLTALADTHLSMVSLQHTQDNTTDHSGDPFASDVRSRAFSEGVAEFTTDGGARWSPLYEFSPQNMQFYFVTTSR